MYRVYYIEIVVVEREAPPNGWRLPCALHSSRAHPNMTERFLIIAKYVYKYAACVCAVATAASQHIPTYIPWLDWYDFHWSTTGGGIALSTIWGRPLSMAHTIKLRMTKILTLALYPCFRCPIPFHPCRKLTPAWQMYIYVKYQTLFHLPLAKCPCVNLI